MVICSGRIILSYENNLVFIDSYSITPCQYLSERNLTRYAQSKKSILKGDHKKKGVIIMDRIIRNTLGLFMIIFVVFFSVVSYQIVVENAYLSSLSSTYSYTCTITIDSPLSNVTLFIPVPADTSGNSPIVERFSAHDIAGLPDDWIVTLYDTGKATMVRISAPVITPPQNTTPENPFTFALSAVAESVRVIDTREPIKNSALFRPLREVRQVSCVPDSSKPNGTPLCYNYQTSLYADYRASPDALVSITSSITGKNRWKIFEPRSNEYTASMSLLMAGEKRGWENVKGFLQSTTGIYDAPDISSR
jgi:hypothetical protein